MEIAAKKYLGKYEPKRKSDDYLSAEYAAKHLTLISLFSGAGGAALGVAAAGFEVRAMVEWDKAACNTLRLNWVERPDNWREILAQEKLEFAAKRKSIKNKRERFVFEQQNPPHYWWQERPPAILQADITKLTTQELLKAAGLRVGEATMLEGGFPCQGFSLANSRRNNDDFATDERNFLYLECVRVIREALPRSFMLENVPGLVSMEKGRIIRMICNDLANSGYNVHWDIHNAADFGVPQNRKRVIIVGMRNDVLVLPAKGGPQLHIGGAVGTIQHPDWLDKKYPLIKPLKQPSLFDALTKK